MYSIRSNAECRKTGPDRDEEGLLAGRLCPDLCQIWLGAKPKVCLPAEGTEELGQAEMQG